MSSENFWKLLLTLPIYYYSKDNSLNYFENKKIKVIKIWEGFLSKNFSDLDKDQQDRIEYIAERDHYIPWEYNEIIGFIEIRFNCGKIFPFLYYANKKRLGPSVKRKIILENYHDLPIDIIYKDIINCDNDQIKEKIYQIIDIVESSIPRKSFYISKRQLNDIMPLIDFTRLINR